MSNLGLVQFIESTLETLQHVDNDFDVVLVLLKHPLDLWQDLPADCQIVHVLVNVHHRDQRSILGDFVCLLPNQLNVYFLGITHLNLNSRTLKGVEEERENLRANILPSSLLQDDVQIL